MDEAVSRARRQKPTLGALLVGALALALPWPVAAREQAAVDTLAAEFDSDLSTVAQHPEEGVQTSPLAVALAGDHLRASAWAEHEVCDTGAAWLRLRIARLSLHGDDALRLVPQKGKPLEFGGRSWEGRAFFTRAFEGECVQVRARLRHPESRVLIDALQSSGQPLTLATTVVAAVGDICDSGLRCADTAAVVANLNPVKLILAGDNAYDNGTLTEYNNYYHPHYGPFKAKTHPAAGNHEYNTAGAKGYFDYFNGVNVNDGPAGPRDKGYYSVDVGDWHVVVLNSNIARGAGSVQEQWLRADLAASTKPCTLASFHHPRFTIGNYAPGDTSVQALYQALQDYKADVIIVGHDHNYQRWKPMTASGTADATNGVRQFLVGTGGRAFYSFTGSSANVEKSSASTWGVLKLTLSPTDYAWEFLGTAGTFTDTGSALCKAKGTAPTFALSASPASVSVMQGASSATTVTVSSQNGFNASVALSCGALPAGVACSFSPASVTPPANGSVNSTLTFSATSTAAVGTADVTVSGVSGALTRSASVALSVQGGGGGGAQAAAYDAVLRAPKCGTVGSSCDSGAALLLGRNALGPEPNQPNTINGSCADGASGAFHADESNDRLKVSTVGGGNLAAGQQVRVEATVWAYSSFSSDKLDLYYAANASAPTWTLIGTLTPTAAGAQTLSATYTLPTGALQAVRARFRYQGSAAPCGTGSYDDHDDLVFAVTSTAPSPDFSLSASPASVSVTQGASSSTTVTVSSQNGFNAAVSLSCGTLPAGVTCGFSPASVTPPANGSASSTLTFAAGGTAAVGTANVTIGGASGTLTRSASVSLSVQGTGGGAQTAVYDSVLKAPKCATVGISCDSGASLLLGRATKGPEPNQPNTINGTCADGTSGTFHSDESNDRLKVSTVDGTNLAAGKSVRIDATVWAYSSFGSDKLDLYYAANASSPTWTFIGTLTPTAAGAQTLSATYTLPAGSLQAVRAQFRYQGAAGTCSTGGYNDRDDLIFAVQ